MTKIHMDPAKKTVPLDKLFNKKLLMILLLVMMCFSFMIPKSYCDSTTLYPTGDTYCYHGSGGNDNYGNYAYIQLGTQVPYEYRDFIIFDVTGIPVGATITSATLRVQYYEDFGSDPIGKDLDVHRIEASWEEMVVVWNTMPSYDTDIEATETIENHPFWLEWDVQSLVQEWISEIYVNYGFLIKFKDESPAQHGARMYSRETANDPELVIEYVVGANSFVTVSFSSGGIVQRNNVTIVNGTIYEEANYVNVTFTALSNATYRWNYWLVNSTEITDNPYVFNTSIGNTTIFSYYDLPSEGDGTGSLLSALLLALIIFVPLVALIIWRR